jgi:outer membrane lipoprotein SlyB
MKNFNSIFFILFLVPILTLSGCVTQSTRPTEPTARTARSAQSVQEGVILDLKLITLKGNTAVAQTSGAVLGGYIGNVLTRDRNEITTVLGTATGAALGSAVGQIAADIAIDQQGVELIIKLPHRIVSIVQQTDERAQFSVGDTVWIIGSGSNIRILPKTPVN